MTNFSDFEAGHNSNHIMALEKRRSALEQDIEKNDKALIRIIQSITDLDLDASLAKFGQEQNQLQKRKEDGEEKNNENWRLIRDAESANDRLLNHELPLVNAIDFFYNLFGSSTTETAKTRESNKRFIKRLESEIVPIAPIEQRLKEIEASIKEYKRNHQELTDNKTNTEQTRTYDFYTHYIIAQQAIHVSQLLEHYARNANTSLDKMLASPITRSMVEPFANGQITREALDILIEWSRTQEGNAEMLPEQLAMKQFINRAVMPHIGTFEAYASMIDDMQKIGTQTRQPLEILRQKDVTFSGRKTISAKAESVEEAGKLAQSISETAKELNTALNTPGTIALKLDKAIQANEKHLKGFEGLFADIDQQINEILKDKADKSHELEEEENYWRHGRDKNERLDEQIGQSEFDINNRKQLLPKGKSLAMRMINQGFRDARGGAIGGGLAGSIVPGAGHAVGGTSGGVLGFLTGLRKGYKNVKKEEAEFAIRQELVGYIRSQKVDVEKHANQIDTITKEILSLIDKKEFQEKVSDDLKVYRIQNAYVARSLLQSAAQNTRLLQEVSGMDGIQSLDELIGSFEGSLGVAMNRFCFGIANSNDLRLIVESANQLTGDHLKPHERVFKDFVEGIMKPDIDSFLSSASMVDAIGQSNLLPYGAPLQLTDGIIRNEQDPYYMALMANEFGMSVVGKQDVKHFFDFYLHRHGDKEFNDGKLKDGQMTDELFPKRVHVESPEYMDSYIRRTKQLMGHGGDKQPQVSDIFLRICAYEYFLQQNVRTAGVNNIFQENPEAPAAYPMVNATVASFIEKMSLGPIQKYREQVGEAGILDNVIAQTFVDYFAHLGLKHAENRGIDDARKALRNSASTNGYGPLFSVYIRKITQDSQDQFKLFLNIYRNNLEQKLPLMTEEDRALLEKHLAELPDPAKTILTPEIIKPGSHRAKLLAEYEDYTLKNTLGGQLQQGRG